MFDPKKAEVPVLAAVIIVAAEPIASVVPIAFAVPAVPIRAAFPSLYPERCTV